MRLAGGVSEMRWVLCLQPSLDRSLREDSVSAPGTLAAWETQGYQDPHGIQGG